MLEQPSFAVMVADTVGAGDACLGGFIASMLTAGEAGLETHLRFAAATAAVVCSRSGAHAPSRSEVRSEEHTSELQSLMRISYAVFCLTKKKNTNHQPVTINI